MTTSMPVAQKELQAGWVGAPLERAAAPALDSPSALNERLARAGARDVVAGMFFLSALEEISRLAGPTAADAARRLALGPGRRSFEPFYPYPVADLLRLMDAGAQMVGGDYAAVLAGFGRTATQAFLDSPIGRTLLVLGGKDAHRLLFTLASGHHTPASFSTRTYERTGTKSAVIRYSAEMLGPGWITGAIEQAFQTVFSFRPQVSTVPGTAAGTFDLVVRW